jgi:hypothetical protein
MIQDNTPPSEPDKAWNTDEIAVGDLTCEAVSRFLNAYVGSFRALATAKTPVDQISTLRALFASQAALFKSGVLSTEDREFAEAQIALGMTAIGMALVTSNSLMEPRMVLGLCAKAMQGINDLASKQDISNQSIGFGVRKSGEDVEIAVNLVPFEQVAESLGANEVSKAIKSIATSTPNPENN